MKARRIAGTLRELRERSGTTVADAARAVDHDASWLSRVERVETRPHPNDVRALLALYGGLDEAAIEAMVAVARQARQRGWWYKFSPVMPDWFDTYVGLETDAACIRTYEPQWIPGLLQTEAYARATLLASATPDPTDHIDQRVALRIERQLRLSGGDDPPRMRVVLDEAAVRRHIGGPAVMREQIEYLIKLAEQPHIQIQVIPFESGAHPGLNGAFVIFDFPPPPAHYPSAAQDKDKIVYLDTLLSGVYLEHADEIATYAAVFEQLRAVALGPHDSCAFLRGVAADL